jgi:hypothetical protein
MPADGLTKGLTKQKNNTFKKQLNLVDIFEKVEISSATGAAGPAPAPGGVCQT